jgi:anaerobic dimethyl sulfoxide reductase subunit C (anchor subunit)
MKHLPLTIFSVFIQAAAGVMIFVAIGNFLSKEANYNGVVIIAACLAVIGLLASLLHLGRPLHAAKALFNFTTSWLSREIWVTAAFSGLTVSTALFIILKPEAMTIINVLASASAIIGLVEVYVMTAVYTSTSVPAWQHGSIFAEFYAAAISMGAVLFYSLSIKELFNMQQIIVAAVAIAVIVQVVAMALYYVDLGANGGLAVQQSLAVLKSMGLATIIKWLFILLGTGLLFYSVLGEGTGVFYTYSSLALVLIGQFVGRYLFYDTMIITQVGLK